MPKLILTKHAKPLIDLSKPSSRWNLSNEGRQAAKRLIDPMRQLGVSKIVSSEEPKAMETATIIAEALNFQATSAPDLHEHDRNNVPHMRTPEFISAMAQLFQEPERLVLGSETAREAGDRIERAIDGVVNNAQDTLAIVTHGTVIALFAQRRLGLEPFAIWRAMGTPSYLIIETDSWRVIERVDRI